MGRNGIPALPSTFTYSQAREAGVSERDLYRLRDEGLIERIGHGLFHRVDARWNEDVDLIEIALRARDATLCLATGLARHGLTDLIPATIDVAIPRGRWRPAVQAPVTWHLFQPETFALGREALRLDRDLTLGIYAAERCIVDMFRLRHREGSDLANSALRRWLRRPGNHPSALLDIARHFPQAGPAQVTGGTRWLMV